MTDLPLAFASVAIGTLLWACVAAFIKMVRAGWGIKDKAERSKAMDEAKAPFVERGRWMGVLFKCCAIAALSLWIAGFE